MTSREENTLRISVGPKDGRRSEVWRIWWSDHDVMLAARHLGAVFKMTLHYPSPEAPEPLFYVGYTRAHAESLTDERPVTLADRMQRSWKGWEFHPGYSFDARIRISTAELRVFDTPNDSGGRVMRVNPAPPLGHAVEFAVMSGPPHHVGPAPVPTSGFVTILHEFQLASGRRVWIVAQDVPSPSANDLDEVRAHIKADPAFESASAALPEPTAAARIIGEITLPDGGGAWMELALMPESSRFGALTQSR